MASYALMFLVYALLSFLLEKQVVATLSLLPGRQGGPSSLVSFLIRVLSSVLSYLSRGTIPPSRDARGDHHLSCYSFIFSPFRASREVVSRVFSSPLHLYNKREGRTDEKTREENRMRGCPHSHTPASPEEDEETARGQHEI